MGVRLGLALIVPLAHRLHLAPRRAGREPHGVVRAGGGIEVQHVRDEVPARRVVHARALLRDLEVALLPEETIEAVAARPALVPRDERLGAGGVVLGEGGRIIEVGKWLDYETLTRYVRADGIILGFKDRWEPGGRHRVGRAEWGKWLSPRLQ